MNITKEHLTQLIKEIEVGVTKILEKVSRQKEEIEQLKLQNKALHDANRNTIEQIKEYIKELEEIRNHYVDSNDKDK